MIITLRNNGSSANFKVDEDQRIYDVLKTISENTEIYINYDQLRYIKSNRRNEKINVLKTFKEAQIFSGDILVLEGKKNG